MRSLLVVLALFILPQAAFAGLPKSVSTCDVRRLASAYKISEKQEAKQLKRLARGRYDEQMDTPFGTIPTKLYYELDYAQKLPGNCSFAQTRYTTADAEQLASIWGTDVESAKRLVEIKIGEGIETAITWALTGGAYQEKMDVNPDQYAYDAFWGSEAYTYCDARVLAEMWKTDEFAAKTHIGDRVHWNDPQKLAVLDSKLRTARQEALVRGEVCEFWETDRTYDDALLLGLIWGTSPEQAKLRASDMVLRGQALALASLLRGH